MLTGWANKYYTLPYHTTHFPGILPFVLRMRCFWKHYDSSHSCKVHLHWLVLQRRISNKRDLYKLECWFDAITKNRKQELWFLGSDFTGGHVRTCLGLPFLNLALGILQIVTQFWSTCEIWKDSFKSEKFTLSDAHVEENKSTHHSCLASQNFANALVAITKSSIFARIKPKQVWNLSWVMTVWVSHLGDNIYENY